MSKDLAEYLREHICVYASFDRMIDADFSRGDRTATYHPEVVRHDSTGGRYGGALVFNAKDHGWVEDEFFYAAKDNFPYSAEPFSGTVSLWLNGDPDADLSDEYPVDPFHISHHSADGSFYLDLTRPNDERYGSPRKLRFGIYGDSPAQDRYVGGQLIVVSELGWKSGDWHHLVATWRNVNTGRNDAAAALYIDGVRRGWMEGYAHQLTWNVEKLTIGLGQRYVGKIDELLILDVEFSGDEVEAIYRLAGPAGELLRL
jgi:hypothetical protein